MEFKKNRKILKIGEMKIDSLKTQSVIPGASQDKTNKREDRTCQSGGCNGERCYKTYRHY